MIDALPLLLAGPILRHTTPQQVSVWVALKQSCQITLQIYATAEHGQALAEGLFVGKQKTITIGQNLHVALVSAFAPAGAPLESDRLYAYDLSFTIAEVETPQTLAQVLGTTPAANLSYFPHQRPTFALPPEHLRDLHLVQGSCRKPHGDGVDTLAILDTLIQPTAAQPRQRPHQLFLTGDQIYADDVADPLLWVASQLGDALLGWEEKLPIGPNPLDPVEYYTPAQLPVGRRAEVATRQGGFTAGLGGKRQKVTSHLLGLGEFYATYLLAWSPVCWPQHIPQGEEICRDRTTAARWNQEAPDLRQFIHTLWRVRRALANVPVYTLFDDHDVSDDWNLNQAWCLRVLGRSLGRRAVQNALLSYAVCQGWGNTPERFGPDTLGGKLLQAAQHWSESAGSDSAADQAIAQYLGMPAIDPHTGLPKFVETEGVLVLTRHSAALTWHYRLQGPCHEVIALDTRTWRGYPASKSSIAPPMLLCPSAFEQQLTQPLRDSTLPDDADHATLIIAPTNVFGLKIIDRIHNWKLKRRQVFSTDVGDAWNIHDEALAHLLTTLFQQRQRIVVLSGDIHYSSVVRLSYEDEQARRVLIQLTASAFKNEEMLTRLLHTRLKDWLLSEPLRRWIGWSAPPDMLELPTSEAHSRPDWACVLEWIPRRHQEPLERDARAFYLRQQRSALRTWLQPLFFWQSRWFQSGREVVGLNNIALVSFETATTPPTVTQQSYWFSRATAAIAVSRFTSDITPNNPLLDQIQIDLTKTQAKK
ncbi:MAG: PhoD-like phosphatase [Leptolyngbyaceae cyanobacterium SM1_1_3]|nr:PhoD-like phosphatase [Leptolyngbyaceae cyanobacterium SM1_1_3]NJN02858.1 PhoD-like phosphatase [Leptolyngbyaceae cyanobacterium RM1_1_2]NJO09099.1 PhoD-like phosphatase [Leptolyngbyaceae cyanobacterium SL_1_1]